MNDPRLVKPKRYILTGGPGAGKTATLDILSQRGFACVPEVARTLINDRISAGLSARPSQSEFGEEILARDLSQYDQFLSQSHAIFFDRGIVDALGMLHECGRVSLGDAKAQIHMRPFDTKVFFFPPWEGIYTTDSERDQTYSEAVQIAHKIRKWYGQLEFRLIDVPIGTPDERADFILAAITAAD